jgi:hypothetical protein
MAGHARHNPISSIRQHGGLVSVTPVRDRTGEGGEAFAVSYHSSAGDIVWLSPKIASEDQAAAAAQCLASFTGSVVRR